MADNRVIFSHPQISPTLGDLVIYTGAQSITWTYGLNTQSFPTYGGEVVQILSAYIDDLTISGQVGSYKMMERIYSWFLMYMNIATQGYRGATQANGTQYNEVDVTMQYPMRGWTMSIRPKSIPNMAYGTDIVVPQWFMTAAVTEPDTQMTALSMAQGKIEGAGLSSLSAGIGFIPNDPFQSPDGDNAVNQKAFLGAKPLFNVTVGNLEEWYDNMVSSYASGDVSSLTGSGPSPYSKPAKRLQLNPTTAVGSAISGVAGDLSSAILATSGAVKGYAHPLSKATGVKSNRIDQGVDFDMDNGSYIVAIGNAQYIGSVSGWFPTLYYYQLLDGIYKGAYVYVAETVSLIPSTRGNNMYNAGDNFCQFDNSLPGNTDSIETGWATSSGETLARETGGYSEGDVTAAGVSFNNFLTSLGGQSADLSTNTNANGTSVANPLGDAAAVAQAVGG